MQFLQTELLSADNYLFYLSLHKEANSSITYCAKTTSLYTTGLADSLLVYCFGVMPQTLRKARMKEE